MREHPKLCLSLSKPEATGECLFCRVREKQCINFPWQLAFVDSLKSVKQSQKRFFWHAHIVDTHTRVFGLYADHNEFGIPCGVRHLQVSKPILVRSELRILKTALRPKHNSLPNRLLRFYTISPCYN